MFAGCSRPKGPIVPGGKKDGSGSVLERGELYVVVRAIRRHTPSPVCPTEGSCCGCMALRLCRLCVVHVGVTGFVRLFAVTLPLLALAVVYYALHTGGDLGRESRTILQLAGVSSGPLHCLIERLSSFRGINCVNLAANNYLYIQFRTLHV